MRDRLRPIAGLGNLPFGLYGGVMLGTIPQLLAAQGVPQPDIASVTAIGLSPGFVSFILAPILDVRLSRRTYAYGLGLLTAILLFMALMSTASVTATSSLTLLTLLLFSGQFAVSLYSSAVGGWLGNLIRSEDEARLGAWFAIGNFAGYGATALVGILLVRYLPYMIGASILGLMVLLPLAMFPFLPSPGPDRRLASESFGRFFADVLELLRKPAVLGALPFFVTPCASFALINTLGALGHDFRTSEGTVAMVLGFGASVPAIGGLLVPRLTRYLTLRPLYLAIGSIGALFTLSLIVLPHTPVTFALAFGGENLFASLAVTVATAIIFDTIGRNNPLAATQFAVLNAAQLIPPTYMQELDGIGYGMGGLAGDFVMDAGLSILACGTLALAMSFKRWRTFLAPQPLPIASAGKQQA